MILAFWKLGVLQWMKDPIPFWNAGWLWTLVGVLLSTLGSAKDVRPNVVAEVPTLDVGPVVVVRVVEGSSARLPCRHPHYPEDTLNLVLWYLGHSARPFLSHDARNIAKNKTNTTKVKEKHSQSMANKPSDTSENDILKNNAIKTKKRRRRRRRSVYDSNAGRKIRDLGAGNVSAASERKSLSPGGTTLIIKNVKDSDEAEYRCRVHFRQSPTWTQRLKLIVADDVETVVLEDGTGRSVDSKIGPLAEGTNLTLTCQASHGSSDVESLWWFLEGKPLDTSWASAGEGVVVNRLAITVVQERFHNARVTCRLVTTNHDDPHIAANITERSITIAMFYVPVAVMKSDGGRALVGGGLELTEGQTLSFLCSVRADPPVYNLIWLHNGIRRSVGGRVLARDNSSLVISPVTRQDSGIYACLASNSEGDGHSNAIPVIVKHLPYCSGPTNQKLVVTANTSVSLTCQVEAQPQDITFTWKIGIPSLAHRHSQSAARGHQDTHTLFTDPILPSHTFPRQFDSDAGVTKADPHEGGNANSVWPSHYGELRSKGLPFVSNDLQIHLDAPDRQGPLVSGREESASSDISLTGHTKPSGGLNWDASWSKTVDGGPGRGNWKKVDHEPDPTEPGKSTVTLTPSTSTVIGCYARNSVGHMEVPCTYTLTVVEPPKALQDCNITLIGVTRMEVRCDDPTYAQDSARDVNSALQDAQHSPSMSFVRSPESSTKANLEVWSGDTLVANVSEGRPIFSVKGLPPDAHLRLVLYTASPHSRSKPLYMFAKTQPRKHIHLSVPPAPQSPTQPPIAEPGLGIGTNLLDGINWRLGGIMGGVAVMVVALVVGIVMWAWEKFVSASDRAHMPPRQLQHYPGITLDTLASDGSLSDEASFVGGGGVPSGPAQPEQVRESVDVRQGVMAYGLQSFDLQQ
ncbi:uncharacterized protein [Macrobrachium rosenbergii]|uniref:uncharacterized protein n=1 Tax=Macrobrachium rosenbergii TaxID=79674 RepID=UPI0034D69F6B